MKTNVDQHRREITFQVGDYVYLKLQPYRQATMEKRQSNKLAPRFYGPFQVLRCIGPVAYELELPEGSQIHNVFHVSKLKLHWGELFSPPVPPPTATELKDTDPQPEKILDHRVVQRGKYQPLHDILVKWVDGAVEDATWEQERRFCRSHPSFSPCGQVDALKVRVHGVPLALNSLVEPFKVPVHPFNFEVQPVEGVGDGGKIGLGLGFGWANGRTAVRGNGGAALSDRLVKDVHHQEWVREEVIVVGRRGDRHVDHGKLRPIDWHRVHDRMEELEILAGHYCVPVLSGLDDLGHDVKEETAIGDAELMVRWPMGWRMSLVMPSSLRTRPSLLSTQSSPP
ncbi:unnamed protein product [Cuscuta campestris]|uniref:Tf2-1-like SH3-like domain-containing protein n=1 Tax=Cuscuta campestris TaxID=132261 RepID=A0A484LN57_9ASTE|nr:unnamed protein product [Cuscuta campestris]